MTGFISNGAFDVAHNAGAKVFCAQSYEQAEDVSDYLDMAVVYHAPNSPAG